MNSIPMQSHWLVRTRLKTRQLLLVVALDDHRNVHRAAEALAMSQPALSKLLGDLEAALGVALFERGPKGVTPNWYGETLVRSARMALANLNRAEEEIRARKAGLTGTVRIGTIVGPTTTLLPRAIQKMNQHFPGVRVSATVDLSTRLLEQLHAGQLDLLLGRLFEEHDKSAVDYERLGSEPVALVTRVGHPLAAVSDLQLEQLLRQSWVLPPSGGVLRHAFDLSFRRYGLAPPTLGVETLSLSLMSELLMTTDMVAILSATVAESYVRDGLFAYVPVPFECDVGDYGLITPSHALLAPAALAAIGFIREEAGLPPASG